MLVCLTPCAQLWSVSIHDRNNLVENWFVNGASHHDLHHREFNFNYGQYFTIWDRIGGSHLEADIHGGDPDAIAPGRMLAPKPKALSKSPKARSKSPKARSKSPKARSKSAKAD